ncbi:MAG: cache domain-containing protein [Deltaproteobacteria bacterium]|nr:cache domain-containing protein [Deltaproteobacteria bacterium]
MKFLLRTILVSLIALGLLGSGAALAADKLTPQMVVDQVNKAVKLIEEKGDAAYAELTDPNNATWVNKDNGLYVFVYDFNGNIVAHLNPKLVGKNLMKVHDVKGTVFAADFVRIAKSPQGEGWTDYWWPKPEEKTASAKTSFVKRVPGKDLLVGAGTYDFTLEDAKKATGIE